MNYPESQPILEEVKKAERILVNCHRGPDPDSVGSALAMYDVLKVSFKKDVTIISPDDLPENTLFLKDALTEELVFKKIEFDNFDFSKYDLFLVLDSGSWGMVRGGGNNNKLDIKTIVIDHHPTNELFGEINLVDKTMSSTAELLYFVFKDWGINPNVKSDYSFLQKAILTGIIGDTGCFRFSNVNSTTMEVAIEMMKCVDKNEIVYNLLQKNSLATIKALGTILSNVVIDQEYKFAYSILSFEEYKQFKPEDLSKELAASYFIQSIDNTNFGFVAVEEKLGELSISFRARNGFDTSKIALELGGGGHKVASGAKIRGVLLDDAVEKVLTACRKYAI